MPAEARFQVGLLDSPQPDDPGYVDWKEALAAAQELYARRNPQRCAGAYPEATAVWSWPDGACLAIVYDGQVFKPAN